MPRRREFLIGMAALLGAPALARAAARQGEPLHLAAAWQTGQAYRVGVLEVDGAGATRIAAALDVPTRAHGLLRLPGGGLLAVARRPGDWLLRWGGTEGPGKGGATAWRWIEPGRAFAGHALASADGATLYTAEIDLEGGAGLIGVRDGATLEKRAEWPTHGLDPHMLAWDELHPGALIVANGGVPTQPETGRMKRDLERMDSSLVRLDARGGALLGQWRLADPRLSLRHLAWNGARLGIALQAEHDAAEARHKAPVLALFDGQGLRTVDAPRPLAGYGGSIAPFAAGFAIGCPRARGVAVFGAEGFRALLGLEDACPLASAHGRLWAGGSGRLMAVSPGAGSPIQGQVPEIRLDNHWIAL